MTYAPGIIDEPLRVVADAYPAGGVRPPRGRTRRLKALSLFARQLAMLVRTGTPLADAMHAVARQLPEGSWRAVIGDLHRQIEQGTRLSAAMARHPAWFNAVSRSMVAAGESSGQLDNLLERLSSLTRQQLKVRRTVSGALLYPVLLMGVGIVVVALMMGFVLPRFSELFESLDAPMPPSTLALMAISEILRSWWWLIIAVVVVAAIAVKISFATTPGRRWLDGRVVRLPWMGPVVRDLVTARLARLLGVLLDSRVPMLEALDLIRESTGNRMYAELVQQTQDAIVRGETLSSTLSASPLINTYVAEAIRHGERSGQISPVLLDMAEFMDEENEVTVKTAARLLEPIMLILLGAVVAVIALSIFVPLFDLTSLTGSSH